MGLHRALKKRMLLLGTNPWPSDHESGTPPLSYIPVPTRPEHEEIQNITQLYNPTVELCLLQQGESMNKTKILPESTMLQTVHEETQKITWFYNATVWFKMVTMRSEKSTCTPLRLYEVSPMSPLKQFMLQCYNPTVELYSLQQGQSMKKLKITHDRTMLQSNCPSSNKVRAWRNSKHTIQ